MATSSALGLADIAIARGLDGNADLVMIDLDLASDRGIETAALLSLFLDKRCDDDDKPPSGDPRDRRGWWADEFLPDEGDGYGSLLWLLDRSVRTNQTALLAEQYVRDALDWMLVDRVVASIDVVITITTDGIRYAVDLHRPGRDPVAFRFDHVWTNLTTAT